MEIKWHGQAFFEIKIKNHQKEVIKVVIDPFDSSIGLRVPKVEADIALFTHKHYDHYNKSAISPGAFFIEEPGEYEIKGVFIKGISAFHDNSKGKERGEVVIYKILGEELSICHLGDFGQKELTEEQLDEIGQLDILMIPVGGVYTIEPKEAVDIIGQLEPKIVIPMHYKLARLKIDLKELKDFLKIIGQEKIESQKKLKILKKDLPQEELKIIVLEP